MSVIFALSLIIEFISFFFYDFSKSRSRDSRHFAIRAMAGATGVTLVTLEIFMPGSINMRYLLLDIMAVVEILLLYPCSFERTSLSFGASLLIVVAVVLSFILSLIVLPASCPSGLNGFFSPMSSCWSCSTCFSCLWPQSGLVVSGCSSGTPRCGIVSRIIRGLFTLMASFVLPYIPSALFSCQGTRARL